MPISHKIKIGRFRGIGRYLPPFTCISHVNGCLQPITGQAKIKNESGSLHYLLNAQSDQLWSYRESKPHTLGFFFACIDPLTPAPNAPSRPSETSRKKFSQKIKGAAAKSPFTRNSERLQSLLIPSIR